MIARPDLWEDLPGGEILREGLADLGRHVESAPALLIEIAAARLHELGIAVPAAATAVGGRPEAELRLYRLLCRNGAADAYGQYNAWLRRLTSLTHALEFRAARARRSAVR